jgi:hypothetical protein
VRGRLYLQDGQPAVGSILYLGEYVGLDANPLVVLDVAQHEYTEVGEEGRFCFRAVGSGRYALIVWSAVESALLSDPATGYSLAVEVMPSEVTDVGLIYTPIP